MITKKPNLLNDNAPDFNNYGDIKYSRDQLLKMEGYTSDDDIDALEMPFLRWSIHEGMLVLIIMEDPEITEDNDPFATVGEVPEPVELNIDRSDSGLLCSITLPIEAIDYIKLESREHHYEDYELPEEYYFKIHLKAGQNITVKGEFGEYTSDGESLPESWFFRHSTTIANM